MPLTDSFLTIILLCFIQGFAIAGVPAAALAYISEEIDSQSMGFATSLYISCNALGETIGRLLMGYVTEHYSWKIAFSSLALLGIAIFIMVLLTLFLRFSSKYYAISLRLVPGTQTIFSGLERRVATPAGTAQNVRRNKRRDCDGCGLRCARGKRPPVAKIIRGSTSYLEYA
jgi:MFS family permease